MASLVAADSPLEAGLLGEATPDLPTRSAQKIQSRLQGAPEGLRAASDAIDVACRDYGVPKQLAAMRWLFHHSALEPGDAIVTGSATLQQLCANLDALDQESGPLPQGLADAIGTAWSEWRGRGPADELGQHGMRHMALARL